MSRDRKEGLRERELRNSVALGPPLWHHLCLCEGWEVLQKAISKYPEHIWKISPVAPYLADSHGGHSMERNGEGADGFFSTPHLSESR